MRSSAACIPAAARTARSASSSWSRGRPKTAITASPMNFSITPPWRSSSARIASKYRVITSRSASESSVSPRLVEPLRSEKTIVTTLRVSCGGRASASCVPHARQNRAISGFSTPQAAQSFMQRVYEAFSQALRACENGRHGSRLAERAARPCRRARAPRRGDRAGARDDARARESRRRATRPGGGRAHGAGARPARARAAGPAAP